VVGIRIKGKYLLYLFRNVCKKNCIFATVMVVYHTIGAARDSFHQGSFFIVPFQNVCKKKWYLCSSKIKRINSHVEVKIGCLGCWQS